MLLSKLHTAFVLLKILLGHRLFGIGYVVRELSHCSNHLIPRVLRMYGASIGSQVCFKDGILIDNADGDVDAKGNFANIRIGDNCYIGKAVYFDLPDEVDIRADCAISAGVKFITHSDCGDRPLSAWYPRHRAKITIGKGCWIGVDAIILEGVNLGECCVVAAGSVVTESCASYSVIAGAPARIVKRLSASGIA